MKHIRQMATLAAVVLTLLTLSREQTHAREMRIPFYGVWMISQARPAPWVDASNAADPYLGRRLVGQKVIFLWHAIDAPGPLGCDRPDYHMVEVPPEGLFQGNLTQPILQAHALGFRPGAPVTTLQTDCEHIIDFHFVNHTTAMFALDNTIYTLRKRR